LTGQPNPATLSQNVTFTAQVSGAAGVPTGTVQFLFLDGATPEADATLNASGAASITTSFCVAETTGPHSLKAHYLGDGTFAANTSAIFTETIIPGPGDFLLTVTPTSASVQLGQSTTMKVTVTSLCGFSQPVNLTCTGASVDGTSCTFNVNPVVVSPNRYPQLSQVTISTTTALPTSSSAKLGKLSTGALLAGALLFLWPRRGRGRGVWLVLLAVALLAGPGCNSGYVDLGTPFGAFTINVTGTAANAPTVTHSVPVTITVN